MKNKISFAVIAGVFTAATIVAPTPGFAQAQSLDAGLYFTDSTGGQGEFYDFQKWVDLSESEKANLLFKYKPENIQIYVKVTSKVATLNAITEAGEFDAASNNFAEGDIIGSFKDAATGEIIDAGDVVAPDLTVKSVMAINDTIKNEAAQQLGFTINDDKKVTVVELEEAGYTVAFEYNKSGAATYAANGKVDGALAASTFEYRVEITPEEGDAITSDWKSVKVIDATTAVKVNEITLVDQADQDQSWTATVLDGKVTIVPSSYENALGETNEENEDIDAPTIKNAVSSDVSIAYWENDVIKVVGDGAVTFEVEFNGIKEKSTITFDAKVKQELASISATAQKVSTADGQEVKFLLLDSDGETYLDADKVYYTTAADATTGIEITTRNKGEASIKTQFTKGDTTVSVYAEADLTTKLGQFKVTAIDVAGNPDAYSLKLATDSAKFIDVKTGATEKEVVLDAKAFIDTVATILPTTNADYHIIAKVSDNTVLALDAARVADTGKITVTAKGTKTGTATVQLYLKEGSKETKVGEAVTVEVKNSTLQIETLTLKTDTKVEVNKAATEQESNILLQDAVIAAINESAESYGDKKVTADHIKLVTPIAANGVVRVEIEDLNGGKVFNLNANIDTDAPTLTGVSIEGITSDVAEGNIFEFNVDGIKEYTTGTATLSEDVTVVVTFGDTTLPAVSVSKSANLVDIALAALKAESGDNDNKGVFGQTLADNSGTTITLTDAADNVTVYTFNFNLLAQ